MLHPKIERRLGAPALEAVMRTRLEVLGLTNQLTYTLVWVWQNVVTRESLRTLGEVITWLMQGETRQRERALRQELAQLVERHLWLRLREVLREEYLAAETSHDPRDLRDRYELEAWATVHDVGPWLDVALHDLRGEVDLKGRDWKLRMDTVGETLTGARGPLVPVSAGLREDLCAMLERKVATADTAHEQAAARAAQRNAPEDPIAREVWDALTAERARMEAFVPARALEEHRALSISFEDEPVRLVYQEETSPPSCTARDRIEIWMQNPRGALTLRCLCPGRHRVACPAKLSALDAALDLLGREDQAAERARVTTLLAAPPWERGLERLLAIFEEPQDNALEVSGTTGTFGWRVELDDDIPNLAPAVIRAKKRGDGFVSKRLSLRTYDSWSTQVEDPRDREIILELLRYKEMRYAHDRPDERTFTARLLTRLLGHPRLFLHDRTTRPLALLKRPVRLHAEAVDDETIALGLASGDTIQHTMSAGRVWLESFDAEGRLLEVDAAQDTIYLHEAAPQVRRAAEALARSGVTFPRGSISRLLEGLDAPGRPNLSLSEPLRGVFQEPHSEVHVHLRMSEGALELGLRATPLEGGQAYPPGHGPKSVYGLESDGAVHTERDFRAERDGGARLLESLELEPDADWTWVYDDLDTALGMVHTLQERPDADDLVRWDTQPASILRERATGGLRVQVTTSRDWFKVGGSLELMQGAIPLGDLLEAMRAGRRYVQLDEERWVKIEGELEEALSMVSDVSHGEKVPRYAAPTLLALEERGAEVSGTATLLKLLERLKASAEAEPELPEGLEADLRPYQRDGFAWLYRLSMWSPGACLADDMGLGKTVQALAMALTRQDAGATLVVAPTSVGFNWQRETERFAPGLTVRPLRAGRSLDRLEDATEGDLFITTYDLVARHIESFEAVAWGTIILDEAQAIKNPATQRSRAIASLTGAFTIALTGTPLENRTGEIWSLFRAIVPGLLGTQASFRRRFAVPIERDGSAKARRALSALLSPFVLRRMKSEVALDLPERTDVRIDVVLSAEERARYEELRRASVAESLNPSEELGAGARRMRLLAAITRLRQLASHPQLYDPETQMSSSKLTLLGDRLEDLKAEGNKALVFSQFTTLLGLTRDELTARGISCTYLDGSMSATARQKAIDAFQNGEHDVFLLSIKAGGTGLNLTAANYVFLLDPWWNPAVEAQATDRAHRIGQRQPVTVYRLVSQDTIEEAIYRMHADKRELFDAVLAGTGSSAPMTPEELGRLIAEHGGEA